MTAATVQHAFTDRPPRRRDRLIAWLILAGCLIVTGAVEMVDLARPPVTGVAEAVALDTALQTHRRQAQFAHEPWSWDRVTPHKDGLPQFEAPPGRTWLHMLALATLTNDATTADAAGRVRLVSVAFVLLTVAGAFWAGMAIGGVVTATMSALICLSMPVLLLQGRTATADPIAEGLTLFAIAAALWSIRPLRPAATLTRQAIGWTLCGLALGAATLVSGATVLIYVIVPIVSMLMLAPHRVGHVMGLVAAVLIAVLMVTPWAGYAHLQEPDVWRTWVATLAPRSTQTVADLLHIAGWRVVILVLAVLPWTLWLPSALMQPFSTSSEGSRNRMFIGWTWFSVVTVLLAFAPTPDGAPIDSVLPGVIAASVMMGQLFRHNADQSAAGKHTRFWRWLRLPQWGLLLAVSIVVPGVGLFQTKLVERGWLPGAVFAPMYWVFWAGVAVVGVGLLLMSLGPILRHYPARAVTWWALWSAVMAALLAIPLARGPAAGDNDAAVVGERIEALAQDWPILYLTDLPTPDPVVMLYSERVFAPVTTAQMKRLTARASTAGELYLLTPRYYSPGKPWEPAAEFEARGLKLWYCQTPIPEPLEP